MHVYQQTHKRCVQNEFISVLLSDESDLDIYGSCVTRIEKTRSRSPSIENSLRICRSLGNPQEQFSSIHVAGTNGKGSVCHKIVQDLKSHGISRIGTFSSPHLFSSEFP